MKIRMTVEFELDETKSVDTIFGPKKFSPNAILDAIKFTDSPYVDSFEITTQFGENETNIETDFVVPCSQHIISKEIIK